MVVIPVRKGFRELQWKKLSVKPENILTLQNYMQSMVADPQIKSYNRVPIELCDTIIDKLGVSAIDFLLDGSGKIFIRETTQNGERLVQFPNFDMVRRICRLSY